MGRRRPTTPEPPELGPSLHGVFPDAELDLHGLRAAQALGRAERFVQSWARRRPGAVLRIVTGRGTHSADGPVLLGAVGEMLRAGVGGRVTELAPDAGGGGWLLRVGRPAGRD